MSYSHDDVAHNWAHKTGRACKGFNMFYSGDTIYSYGHHFPLARHAHTAGGEQCLLVTSRSYSVSTSKHITITRRAIPSYYDLIFYVADPGANNKPAHDANYKTMVIDRETLLGKASRARALKSTYLGGAESLRRDANAYSKAFKLGHRAMPEPGDLTEELAAMMKRHDKAIKAARAKTLKEDKAREARNKEALDRWEAGGLVSPPHTATPHLRVVGEELQTSWGIRIPLKQALVAFRLARRCAKEGKEYIPSNRIEFGVFKLDRISDKGTIQAGCHILPLELQERAAKLAGIK